MNTFATLFHNLSLADMSLADGDSCCTRAASTVKPALENAGAELVSSWFEDDDPYYDFYFAIKPSWLAGTPDDKQVKMCVTLDQSNRAWYATLVTDCEYGECEEWGECEFSGEDIERMDEPLATMLSAMCKQYMGRLEKEQARCSK